MSDLAMLQNRWRAHPRFAELRGLWLCNEGGGTQIYDALGFTPGTFTGSPAPGWGIGQYGSVITTDGTTAYVDLGSAPELDLTDNFTLAVSVYATVFTGTNRTIFSCGHTSNAYWFLQPNTSGVLRVVDDATSVITSSTLSLNQWYRIVFTRQSPTNLIYLNGSLVTTNSTANLTGSSGTKSIGARLEGSVNSLWSGSIDNVMMLNRVWSAEEVLADFYDPMAPYRWAAERSIRSYFIPSLVLGSSAPANYYYRM